jgi:hypothetical protein
MRPGKLSLLSGVLACTLTFTLSACNFNEPVSTAPAGEEGGADTDRYHEKSFSWDSVPKPAVLAKAAALETRFETAGALAAAVAELEEQLKNQAVSDEVWKPIDYACDELDLALWNRYGTISVGGETVLDENGLKARCRYIGDNAVLARAAGSNPPKEAVDRQYPYKLIGNTWHNFDAIVYKSTGGETQFKKHRERFGFTGWYDTDATRIGVRIYLFDCASTGGKRICYLRRSTSDAYSGDDYVSKREFAVGFSINGTLRDNFPDLAWLPVPSWSPDQFNAKLAAIDNSLHNAGLTFIDLRSFLGDFYAFVQGFGIKVPSVSAISLRVADGVIGLHSADHAGLRFRATSSSGLGDINTSVSTQQFDFVTW